MSIKLFHKIDDAVAIIRVKGGIHKQVGMYRRGDRVYIPLRGGYARLVCMFGDGVIGTDCPNTSVIEFEADGVRMMQDGKVPTFVGGEQ